MFSWFAKSEPPKPPALFNDAFTVVDLELLSKENRTQLELDGSVGLYSNMTEQSNWMIFFEVIFTKGRFMVFHSKSKPEAQEMFNCAKVVINALECWFTPNREVIYERLRSIMETLSINRHWTVAHVCARLGTFDSYFLDELPPEVINCQVEPDLYTPIHLAIKQFNLPTVRLLLGKAPNLSLVNQKKHSVLHYAAVSTQEIATLILNQEGMFDRILWKDNKGCTALHLACFIQKFDIVFEFLKFGLTVRMLTLSPPNSRPKNLKSIPSDSDPAMQKIVHFTEQDFDDIDCQDIFCGGCPLHWVKHKRLAEKLLDYAFPLNCRNCNGESPLHVVSKRLRLKCVIAILCAGANVNAANIFGNTPLHLSVKENDLVVPQTLIVFDANIDARNYSNESVRHVAAKACSSASNEAILYLLSALGAKRCPPIKNTPADPARPADRFTCSIGCSFSGDFEGNVTEKLFGVDQKYDRLYKDFLFGDFIRANEARTPEKMAAERCVNMLSLDGGGIKGLVTLQMMKEVERYLKHPFASYFTWFSGTSTGSFISAFLSMGISLNQIRATYFRFKDKVLTGQTPYSSAMVEKVLREALGNEITMADILAKFGKYLVIPSAIANRRPMKLHIFRSFPSVQEIFEEAGREDLAKQLLPDRDKDLKNYRKYEDRHIEVWKACRASGAAPYYFRAFGDFLDGGLITNNPTLDALAEFEQYQAALKAVGRGDECQKLQTVVSFGTGKGLLQETDVLDLNGTYSSNIRQAMLIFYLLMYEVCQTEQHIVTRAESYCHALGTPYFRINTFLSEMMELDEQQDYKIINCLWETKRFMYYRRDQVKVLANYLEKCTRGLPFESTKGKGSRTTRQSRQSHRAKTASHAKTSSKSNVKSLQGKTTGKQPHKSVRRTMSTKTSKSMATVKSKQ